ncbi:hypothetical protein [Neobacillus niacini]|uniref:hypothetical protein n=1 Tax=Neobacillus niacini TaxID=86668 RepID=UPI003000C1C7
MLQGICVNSGQSVVLEKGKRYFLFPNGTKHFYVSNFPNKNAHKGCFQTNYFQIIEKEEWPQEPKEMVIRLDPEKIYKANLIWRKPGYKTTELKEYYVQPKMTHGYFYHNKNLIDCGGCFPLHWFANFVEVNFEENVTEAFDFAIELDERVRIFEESVPKRAEFVQLSIFDF